MKKIGLTGGIGVGKTYVAKVFKRLGVPVFDADCEAKTCLTNNHELIESVKSCFGNEIYDQHVLQKEALARIVFSNKLALEKLNSLVHPIVGKRFNLWCQQQDCKLIIKEAAILFETNSYLNLDGIICVSASDKLRIQRIQQRDQFSKEQIIKRINNQMSQRKKEERSDYIIYNDENQLVLPQILHIIKEIS